jgi:hypothetical protein
MRQSIVRQSHFSRLTDQSAVRYSSGASGFLFRNGAQTHTYHNNGDIGIDFDEGAHRYHYNRATQSQNTF